MPFPKTYDSFDPEDDLYQGDIIRRTPEVIKILSQAHNHFMDEKYTAFIILSQSCDLSRRGGSTSSSRYINLAVVRPLVDILPQLIDSVCDHGNIGKERCERFYTKETRYKAEMLIERIVNQNESKIGLFYLHPDADAGIAESSVALLRITIALRREHYDNLVLARAGHLTSEFQHRLGWLFGHIYSRVAIDDWEEDQRKSLTEEFLKVFGWIHSAAYVSAKKEHISPAGMTFEALREKLSSIEKAPPIDLAIQRTIDRVRDVLPETTDEKIEQIEKALRVDRMYTSCIKQK